MCGIAGIARASRAPVDRETLERMCEAQVHRGPDARGLHLAEGVGLGIQRLRVIDLVTGDQPIHNEDRTVDRRAERRDLQLPRAAPPAAREAAIASPPTATPRSIVHLYEELGPDCVRELHGMFAFALWDSRRHQLLLARDRVGKKPLFYSVRDGAVSFASELAALMQDREVPREIDHQALDAYLAYGYVPAPLSAFAARAQADAGQHAVLPRRPDRAPSATGAWTTRTSVPSSPAEELHEQIRETIRRGRAAPHDRRRSHRRLPVRRHRLVRGRGGDGRGRPDPVKTFSIGFEERALQRAAAGAAAWPAQFATDHHELIVRPDAIELLPRIVRHYGEPFADHSAIPSFYLAALRPRTRDGGAERRRRRRELRAATSATRPSLALAELDRLPLALRRGPATLAGPTPRRRPARVARAGWPLRRGGRARSREPLPAPALGVRRSTNAPRSTRAELRARMTRALAARRRRCSAPGAPSTATDARGPHAGRRRQQLSARRPAGQDRHRDDGLLARGSLAAARPRADGARRLDAAAAEGLAAARSACCARRCGGGYPTTSSTAPSRASELPVARWLRRI